MLKESIFANMLEIDYEGSLWSLENECGDLWVIRKFTHGAWLKEGQLLSPLLSSKEELEDNFKRWAIESAEDR